MNSDFLYGIQPAENPLIMSTNAGMKKMNIMGYVKGFGEAYYDPSQMANIFSFSHLVDKCRITYDSDIEDAFIVHRPNGPIKFSRTKEGLYAYKPTENFKRMVAMDKKMLTPPPVNLTKGEEADFMVSSVQENRKGYTQ